MVFQETHKSIYWIAILWARTPGCDPWLTSSCSKYRNSTETPQLWCFVNIQLNSYHWSLTFKQGIYIRLLQHCNMAGPNPDRTNRQIGFLMQQLEQRTVLTSFIKTGAAVIINLYQSLMKYEILFTFKFAIGFKQSVFHKGGFTVTAFIGKNQEKRKKCFFKLWIVMDFRPGHEIGNDTVDKNYQLSVTTYQFRSGDPTCSLPRGKVIIQ